MIVRYIHERRAGYDSRRREHRRRERRPVRECCLLSRLAPQPAAAPATPPSRSHSTRAAARRHSATNSMSLTAKPPAVKPSRARVRLLIILLSLTVFAVCLITWSNAFGRAIAAAHMLDCARLIRRGDAYGGWTMCSPLYSLKDKIVYTIGIGRNIKWDEAMMKQFGTVHHGWDPTPTAEDFFSKRPIPNRFVFHRVGLASYDGDLKLKLPEGNADSYTVMEQNGVAQEGKVGTFPVLKLQTMMKDNGHEQLAILKIDVEGAEFDVIRQWCLHSVDIAADQVLIEFHARYFDKGPQMVREAIEDMDKLGFWLVHKTKLEYTFAKKNLIAKRGPEVGVALL